jgi:hypothetical protein
MFVLNFVSTLLHTNKTHTLRRRLDWPSFLIAAQLNMSACWPSTGVAKVMPGVHSDVTG